MSVIEFYDPEDVCLNKVGRKSVVITSFVKKDIFKELKKKFRRVIPIFVKSKMDEENLKQLLKEYDHRLKTLTDWNDDLSRALEKYKKELRTVKEEVASKATVEIINSLIKLEEVEGVCFNTHSSANFDEVSKALVNLCNKHNCYVIHVLDYWDWDYGGKKLEILNPDEHVSGVDPLEILGRTYYKFCLVSKKSFRDAITRLKEAKEKARRRFEVLSKALEELRKAVSYKKEFDKELGEEVYEFKWDESKVKKIMKKYNLSDKELKELKDEIEKEIMFKEPAGIYY